MQSKAHIRGLAILAGQIESAVTSTNQYQSMVILGHDPNVSRTAKQPRLGPLEALELGYLRLASQALTGPCAQQQQ